MTTRNSFVMLALAAACTQAWAADDSIIPPIKVSGFGTAALTWTDTNDAQFSRPNQMTGAGTSPRTGVDSLFGVQADTRFTPWLSATVQGLVRKNAREGFRGTLSWALLKAKINDEFSVRAGRIGSSSFLISDYRNIGYANTTLRPPIEVYAQMPVDTFDGVDVLFNKNFGDTTVTAQAGYGGTKVLAAARGNTIEIEASRLSIMSIAVERGPLTVRLSRSDTTLNIENNPSDVLLTAIRGAGQRFQLPALSTMADELSSHNKKASFTAAGAILDWKNILVQSEYAVRKVDTNLPDTTSWYLTGGYRMGKFLPYYTHANVKVDRVVTNTIPTSCAIPGCLPVLNALSAGVAALTARTDQTSDTLGLRWDFASSAALKVQVDRVRPKSGTNGLFVNAKPGFKGPVTVGAVAVDFVF